MKVVGVVPAAGRSTRIGNPKPLLDAGGRTFLERVVAALRGGGVERVLVGVREGQGPIPAHALRLGAEVFVPDGVDEGPIATLRGAIRRLEDEDPPVDALLLHPADHPLVTAETVAALVERYSVGDTPLVRPVLNGTTGHPVVLGRALFPELLAPNLPEGARTVVDRRRDEGALVEVEDRGVLADIDTLGEYRRHFPDSYRKRFQKW